MEKQITILLDAIVEDYARFTKGFHNPEEQVQEFKENLTVSEGSKYIRIDTKGSVWGFINKGNKKFQVGDLLKAAGYRAPATNKARGNIFETYSVAWTGPHYLADHSGGLARGMSKPIKGDA